MAVLVELNSWEYNTHFRENPVCGTGIQCSTIWDKKSVKVFPSLLKREAFLHFSVLVFM